MPTVPPLKPRYNLPESLEKLGNFIDEYVTLLRTPSDDRTPKQERWLAGHPLRPLFTYSIANSPAARAEKWRDFILSLPGADPIDLDPAPQSYRDSLTTAMDIVENGEKKLEPKPHLISVPPSQPRPTVSLEMQQKALETAVEVLNEPVGAISRAQRLMAAEIILRYGR